MTRGSRSEGSGSRPPARSQDDLHYFQDRAEQEIRRAELADHPDAVRAHYQLAGYYLDLVHNRSGLPPRRPRRG